MKIDLERECTGYKYTGVEDNDRQLWSVTTCYINEKVYLSAPDDEDDLDQIIAFGKAVVKACQDMKRENTAKNRTEI